MATITSPRPQSPANPNRNAIQSPNLTPSSSVRPSIDLPNTTSTINGRPASPARRNRAALRDYYNLKSKPPSSTSPRPGGGLSRTASVASIGSESTVTSNVEGGPTTTTTLPAQLDEPSFDADGYVQKLLASETLRGVLKIEGALVSEIKQLDGERKALVYDNYSKLIVATRTIGRMQRSLEGGGEGGGMGMQKMERLRPAVEGVEKVAGEIGRAADGGSEKDGGKERAERRARKDGREKKELVRWVVEAPGRFEGYVLDGKSETVREEWEVLDGLLVKWKGVKGAEEVRLSCERLVSGLEEADDEGEGEGEAE